MFFYKKYLKWKLKAIINENLLFYSEEMRKYADRQAEWQRKEQSLNDKLTGGRFMQIRAEQIRFSNDEWKRNYHSFSALQQIIHVIENL